MKKNARIHYVNRVVNFVRESYEELKRIKWPSRDETIRLTAYVIGVSLVVGLFVTGFDYIFKEILTGLIG
ncbi:preprotein translocase subunit SecE [candidate division WWE3 bacterium]|uniref:Protein translocase subunit SecE n=1 Tax=candidate division WWE3 bacterium TaxID=2053526 RepID=A0A3A4ZM98_UNCKA|nr:MAG: preprotein translocase subunit SecE [candidate division WWE3 bacterium]